MFDDNNVRYTALAIDPDSGTRQRLKQAATAVITFQDVQLIGDLRSAVSRLEIRPSDVIFIAEEFGKEEIAGFITTVKQTGGADAAFVLVLGSNDQKSTAETTCVMLGAHAVLTEPYSVDSLVDITRIAAKVKKENHIQREKNALSLLVKDMTIQIDRLSYLKACECDPGRALKQFKDLCAIPQSLQGESLERYFDIMIEQFEQVPVPIAQVRQYKGVSQRIKSRMQQKLMAEIEQEEKEGKNKHSFFKKK
jgi:CheY-like chemotaxis protein